jgi:hypothetical protein
MLVRAAFAALVLAASASAQVINEFSANHVGTDTNEYIEVFGLANTAYTNLSVIQLEGDGGSAQGNIDTIYAVGTTDANGIVWSGFLNNIIENGTITLLLVADLSMPVGTDLDTDNNGTLDSTPWSGLLDAVGVNDGGAGDLTYGNVTLTSALAPAGFAPGGASRIPNGVDTDAVSDWLRNDFDNAGIPGFPGTLDAAGGECLNTPGAPNEIPEPASIVLLSLAMLTLRRR